MNISDRLSFLNFQKGVMIACILIGHFMQFYVYKGSEAYWTDPIFKTLYIFIFAYYMGVNGYLAAGKLSSLALVEVLRFKFLQFLLPLGFWLAVLLAFLVGIPAMRPNGSLAPGALFGLMANFWILFTDVLSIVALRLLAFVPVNARIVVPISMLVVLLIPNGERFSLLALLRYGYIATAAGYLMGVTRFDFGKQAALLLVLLPLCGVIYVLWTTDTFIYQNRLNILDPYKRGQIALMLIGIITYSLAAFPILRWIYMALSRAPALFMPIRALSRLYSPVIMFEVVFFLVINHTGIWRSGSYFVDLLAATLLTTTAVCLIRASFVIIRPGTPLFHLIWGTVDNLGDRQATGKSARSVAPA